MKPGRASATAEGVAALRAAEGVLRARERRVLEDPVAGRLLGGYRRWLLRSGPLLRLLVELNSRRYPGMVWEVLARAAYARERITALAAAGNRQVVILGAGLDTTAWWSGLPGETTVFEVDTPSTQDRKRSRLADAGIPEPSHVRFVCEDLSRSQGLKRGLVAAGFAPGETSLFTALGLIPYLSSSAVTGLFSQTGECLEGGGEVVYTFPSPRLLDRSKAPAGARRIARRLERMGEPLLFGAEPTEMAGLVRAAGLEQVEVLDGAAMTARYLARKAGRRWIEPGLHLARAVR